MKIEYLSLFVLIGFSFIFSGIIMLISYLLAQQAADVEKVSAYECGFNPFEDARHTFDIRFYLVAILFIIFDLEVSFLFPWSFVLYKIGFTGFWMMFLFLLILTIGFFYEWKKGGLDWQ